MMIVLEGTKTTPLVDMIDGYMRIQGNSIPIVNFGFYRKLMSYLKEYAGQPKNITIIDISFDYINCYSQKSMMQVFHILKQIHRKDKAIIINWYYSKDDDAMLELGYIYQSLIDLPFNFIMKQ